MACRLASPGPGNSRPYLNIFGTWFSAWPAGWPHLELVSVDATWASPIPCDSGLHVGLLDLVNLPFPGPLLDQGTLVTPWASPGPGESGPHLRLTQSW